MEEFAAPGCDVGRRGEVTGVAEREVLTTGGDKGVVTDGNETVANKGQRGGLAFANAGGGINPKTGGDWFASRSTGLGDWMF